jgi:hypothetical protein
MKSEQAVLPNPCLEEEEKDDDDDFSSKATIALEALQPVETTIQ